MKKETLPTEASPFKSAVEGLDGLRKTFQLTCRHYAERVEREIVALRERVAAAGAEHGDATVAAADRRRSLSRDRDSTSRVHDLRDMLTILRTLDIKSAAGKRRDLKRIESAVEDLRMLIERWG